MPSFQDSIFLGFLALLLFGPKKLPVLARELGKWVGEFRRASNEFKMQMEEELRLSEQADRQKEIAAMEAAAPVAPALPVSSPAAPTAPEAAADPLTADAHSPSEPAFTAAAPPAAAAEPLPIAVQGELKIMPPATGLPTPRPAAPGRSALSDLLESIPVAAQEPPAAQPAPELAGLATHGEAGAHHGE